MHPRMTMEGNRHLIGALRLVGELSFRFDTLTLCVAISYLRNVDGFPHYSGWLKSKRTLKY